MCKTTFLSMDLLYLTATGSSEGGGGEILTGSKLPTQLMEQLQEHSMVRSFAAMFELISLGQL